MFGLGGQEILLLLVLGVLLFGLVLAQIHKDFSKPWLSVSLTLFVVAVVLLVIIMRDQHRAIAALELAAAAEAPAAGTVPAAEVVPVSAEEHAGDEEAAQDAEPVRPNQPGSPGVPTAHIASVERGRIATMGGVVALIYLVILVLMIWNG